MNGMQNTYGDKERMTDLLYMEKQLASQYCTFLAEAATPAVLQTLSDLFEDTHKEQHALFEEINSRGWYPLTSAADQKIAETKQKFAAMVTA